MKIALVIIWGIIGILNLTFGEISRLSYGMAWFLLMVYMILDVIK